MREILFRGKQVDNGEWVYGGFCYGNNRNEPLICPKYDFSKEVTLETVGQYTGMTDKNGKKIFEGDIVKLAALSNDHKQKGVTTIAIIENYMGNTCININGHQTGTTLYSIIVDHTVEVIGNIYDNPELLKGGAE